MINRIELYINKFQAFVYPEANLLVLRVVAKVDSETVSSSKDMTIQIVKQKIQESVFVFDLYAPTSAVYSLFFEAIAVQDEFKRTFDRCLIDFENQKIETQSVEARISITQQTTPQLQQFELNAIIPNMRLNQSQYFFDRISIVVGADSYRLHYNASQLRIIDDWMSFLVKIRSQIPPLPHFFKLKIFGYNDSFPAHEYLISSIEMEANVKVANEIDNVKVQKTFVQLGNLILTKADDKKLQRVREVLIKYPYIVDSYYTLFDGLKEIRPQRAFVNCKVEDAVSQFLDQTLVKNYDFLSNVPIRMEYNGNYSKYLKVTEITKIGNLLKQLDLSIFGLPEPIKAVQNQDIRQLIFSFAFLNNQYGQKFRYLIFSLVPFDIHANCFSLLQIFHVLNNLILFVDQEFQLVVQNEPTIESKDLFEPFNILVNMKIVVLNFKAKQPDFKPKQLVLLHQEETMAFMNQYIPLVDYQLNFSKIIYDLQPFNDSLFKTLHQIKSKWKINTIFDRTFPLLKIPQSHQSSNNVEQLILLIDHYYESYISERDKIMRENKVFKEHPLVQCKNDEIEILKIEIEKIGVKVNTNFNFKTIQQLEEAVKRTTSVEELVQFSHKLRDIDYLNQNWDQCVYFAETVIDNCPPFFITEKNFGHCLQTILQTIIVLNQQNQILMLRKFADVRNYCKVFMQLSGISTIEFNHNYQLLEQITLRKYQIQDLKQLLESLVSSDYLLQNYEIDHQIFLKYFQIYVRFYYGFSLFVNQNPDFHEVLQMTLIGCETIQDILSKKQNKFDDHIYACRHFVDILTVLQKHIQPKLIFKVENDLELMCFVSENLSVSQQRQLLDLVSSPIFLKQYLGIDVLAHFWIQPLYQKLSSSIYVIVTNIEEKDHFVIKLLVYLDYLIDFKEFLFKRSFIELKYNKMTINCLKFMQLSGNLSHLMDSQHIENVILSHNDHQKIKKLLFDLITDKYQLNFDFMTPYSVILEQYCQNIIKLSEVANQEQESQFINPKLNNNSVLNSSVLDMIPQLFLKIQKSPEYIFNLDINQSIQVMLKFIQELNDYKAEFDNREYVDFSRLDEIDADEFTLQKLHDLLNFKCLIHTKFDQLFKLQNLVEFAMLRGQSVIQNEIVEIIEGMTAAERERIFQLTVSPLGNLNQFYEKLLNQTLYLQVEFLCVLLLLQSIPPDYQKLPYQKRNLLFCCFQSQVTVFHRYNPQHVDLLRDILTSLNKEGFLKIFMLIQPDFDIQNLAELNKNERIYLLLQGFQQTKLTISALSSFHVDLGMQIDGLLIFNRIMKRSIPTQFIANKKQMIDFLCYSQNHKNCLFLFEIQYLNYWLHDEYYVSRVFDINQDTFFESAQEPVGLNFEYISQLEKLSARLIYLDNIYVLQENKIHLIFDDDHQQVTQLLLKSIKQDYFETQSSYQFEKKLEQLKVSTQILIDFSDSVTCDSVYPKSFNTRMKLFVQYITETSSKKLPMNLNFSCQFALFRAYCLMRHLDSKRLKFDVALSEEDFKPVRMFLLNSQLLKEASLVSNAELPELYSKRFSELISWLTSFVTGQCRDTIYRYLRYFPKLPVEFLKSKTKELQKPCRDFIDFCVDALLTEKNISELQPIHCSRLFLFIISELSKCTDDKLILPKLQPDKIFIVNALRPQLRCTSDQGAAKICTLEQQYVDEIISIHSH